MDSSIPGFPILHHLPEFAQTHVHWVDGVIQPSHLLLPPSPHALNLSQHQGLFHWVSSSYQIAKILELYSFSICPFNECPELISFKIDWFDLLAVQGTLKSLLQHHSSKAYVFIFFSGSFPFYTGLSCLIFGHSISFPYALFSTATSLAMLYYHSKHIPIIPDPNSLPHL